MTLTSFSSTSLLSAACLAFGLVACGEPGPQWTVLRDSTDRALAITGLSGPEAVRYDPDQDVYFIANFNGEAAGDSNGFISRARAADGVVEALEFMTGTEEEPLHGPRGMFITGDTLWAADADGLHGFNRVSGEHVAFVDMTSVEPGFLNDITAGPDGALYVTDTGRWRVYHVADGSPSILPPDSLPVPPNGITWDAGHGRFILAPWGDANQFYAWTPGNGLELIATSPGARFDGIEVFAGRIIVASQGDSSLHSIVGGVGTRFLSVPGRPADIGIDTRRERVAVPYIALDRVDVWSLPAGTSP